MKFYQFKTIHFGDIGPERQSCIDSVQRIMLPGDTFELIHLPALEKPIRASDTLRLEMAALTENAHMLYFDSDLYWLSRPSFERDGIPYFDGFHGRADTDIIYVNGCTQFFADLPKTGTDYGWPMRALKGLDTARIDNRHFKHMTLSRRRMLADKNLY
jgi:hypothetical protein